MRSERSIVALLCCAAALRAVIFSAAFPFFNNVDEALHFDAVMRYSLGRPPQTYGSLADETLAQVARYASPEFMAKRTSFPDARFPTPLWKQNGPEADAALAATADAWRAAPNFELSQPPLYYVLTALWLDAGRIAGMHGLLALYWVRFLNGAIVAAVVSLGYSAARFAFAANHNVRIGVPLLLAFFPQAIFFSIENDVLSPLTCAAMFVITQRADTRMRTRGAVLAGLAIAAAYLTKLSNVPFLIVAAAAVLWRIWRTKPKPSLIAVLVVIAAIPIGLWMWWSKTRFGDVTGSAEKIAILGWRRKAISDWLNHPLFSIHGVWMFAADLLATFWRGELVWEGDALRSAAADMFYIASSVVLPVCAVIGSRGAAPTERSAIVLSAVWFLAGIAFLAFLSVQFDYGRSVYPSRDFPYFTSGRLIAGGLVPFALLYVRGLDVLLGRWNRNLPLVALAVIVTAVTLSAIAVNAPVFASEHNLLHR